jgi:D-3-phosphoglycerate dehydrogenase
MVFNNYKVIITDKDLKNIDVEKDVFKDTKIDLRFLNTEDEDMIINEAKNAHGIMCTYAKINSKVISQFSNCKVIARYGTGVDNIDVEAASKAGISVANIMDYSILEVSNHTIAFIVALNRNLIAYDKAIRNGSWGPVSIPVYRLDDLVLGLIGFGNIAQMVAKKAIGIGLKVISYDPYIGKDFMVQKKVTKMDSIDELLRQSDFVSLHVPLNKKTRGLIGEEELKIMKSTACIINTSRGGLIREEALVKALKEKWISGAGLDVYEKEPISKENKFIKLDNIILTPHAAFYSLESQEAQQRLTAKSVFDVLNGDRPKSLFNIDLLKKYGYLGNKK